MAKTLVGKFYDIVDGYYRDSEDYLDVEAALAEMELFKIGSESEPYIRRRLSEIRSYINNHTILSQEVTHD